MTQVKGSIIGYTKEQVLEAIKDSNGIVLGVAKKLDCSWTTAKTYIEKWEITKKALSDEKQIFGDFCESKAMASVEGGSEHMIRFYLTTLYKDRGFTEKRLFEHSGDPENPIVITDEIEINRAAISRVDKEK